MSTGFLVDTNVLSELMREKPEPQVLAWFASQTVNLLQTSAVIRNTKDFEGIDGLEVINPWQPL